VNQVAASNATVLILGESGTGKELVAKAIHGLSRRRGRPFVALNCAALSEGLLDSELFGHEKGAFTGAAAAREGRFEFADKGTLFLDEVGDMPLPVQVKLLRVIQERTITRVGSNEPIEVDVRLIAATHKNLEQEVRKGTFREDLYWRLKVVSIHVPALREHKGDIPILVERFVAEFARRHGRPTRAVTPEAMRLLLQYDWPGNVRELQNVVESMVLLSPGETLDVDSVPGELQDTRPGTALVAVDALDGMTLKRVERELIRLNLEKFKGNRARAAKALGISERTLYRKIKEYGVP
jgi:two-component system, NtrC family, response regulator HydG